MARIPTLEEFEAMRQDMPATRQQADELDAQLKRIEEKLDQVLRQTKRYWFGPN